VKEGGGGEGERERERALGGYYYATATFVHYSCDCVFITSEPITKLFAWGGGGEQWRRCATRDYEPKQLCGLVCPSRTSERGGEGYCVKGGGGEEGERERERAREVRLHYSLGYSG
jgi:hypothetical protein